jgi:hypothetical protein
VVAGIFLIFFRKWAFILAQRQGHNTKTINHGNVRIYRGPLGQRYLWTRTNDSVKIWTIKCKGKGLPHLSSAHKKIEFDVNKMQKRFVAYIACP